MKYSITFVLCAALAVLFVYARNGSDPQREFLARVKASPDQQLVVGSSGDPEELWLTAFKLSDSDVQQIASISSLKLLGA